MSDERNAWDGIPFPCILADPPWKYGGQAHARTHGAASAHYAGLTTAQLCAIPVAEWATKDAFLFLWATNPTLRDAMRVGEAWGFSYVTSIPWIKYVARVVELGEQVAIRTGVGLWTRGASEHLTVWRRGKAKTLTKLWGGEGKPAGLLHTTSAPFFDEEEEEVVFWAPRKGHSEKPLEVHEWIERQVAGPRLELFATKERVGWTTWGALTGVWLDATGARLLRLVSGAGGGEEVPRGTRYEVK